MYVEKRSHKWFLGIFDQHVQRFDVTLNVKMLFCSGPALLGTMRSNLAVLGVSRVHLVILHRRAVCFLCSTWVEYLAHMTLPNSTKNTSSSEHLVGLKHYWSWAKYKQTKPKITKNKNKKHSNYLV